MENNNKSQIGCLSVVGIVFVILKLTDNIDWSWWWVTLPFYFPLLMVLFFLIVVGIFKILT